MATAVLPTDVLRRGRTADAPPAREPAEPVSERFWALLNQVPGIGDPARASQIAVTSAVGGEGVTTVSLNLAVCASRAFDREVLWVNTGGLSPELAERLGTAEAPGLWNLVQQRQDAATVLQPSNVKNLAVVTAGQPPAGTPVRILRLEHIREALASWSHTFGTVVLDLPPVAQMGNPQNLRGLWDVLDAVLLVVAAERTAANFVRRAAQSLEQAEVPLLGVVYNQQHSRVPRWLRRAH